MLRVGGANAQNTGASDGYSKDISVVINGRNGFEHGTGGTVFCVFL